MKKSYLIKRIEILENQVKNIKNPDLLSDAQRRAEEVKIKNLIYHDTLQLRNQIEELSSIVMLWKQVFYTSGIVVECDADRTEFQWQPVPQDKLHRNPHFRINKVITEKEKK